jgi:DNA polymerase-1
MFVVNKGNVLIEADEGQNEFRWWGIYSNDPQLVRDLNDGVDIHKLVAALANKIPIEQVTKEQRQKAKSIVFGLMFNMGSDKLAKNHGVTIEYAEEVKATFFSRYPTAKQWKYEIVKFARKNLYVQSRFGRVRHLVAINHQDNKIAYADEQGAVNSPIQGSASDYVSNAANRIFMRLKDEGLHGKLRNLVHDAVYVEAPKEELKQTLQIINEEMTRKILGIQVPLVCEFKVGVRWGRMHKIEVVNNPQKQVAN